MPDRRTQARDDRLKAALRENLKRRKAQARGRQADTRPATGAEVLHSDQAGEGDAARDGEGETGPTDPDRRRK